MVQLFFLGMVTVAQISLAHSSVPLSLPSAISLALSQNKNIAMSRLTVEGERHLERAADADFGVKLIPSISIGKITGNSLYANSASTNYAYGLQLGKKFSTGMMIFSGPTYNPTIGTNEATLNVSVTQPLLRGFGFEPTLDPLRRARYAVSSSEQLYKQTQINTALETISTFYEALKQKEIARRSRELSERLRQHALVTGKKEKSGLSGPMETYRAVIRLKDAEDSLSLAETAYGLALSRLKLLLEMKSDENLELEVPPEPAIDGGDLEKGALDANVELLQLNLELEEASRLVRVANNATLPDVSLQVSYGMPMNREGAAAQPQQWSVYLQSSSDLLSSAERSNLERARVRVSALELNLEHKKADIRRQVQQFLLYLSAAKERMALREDQIKKAEGKLALAQVKFSNDMADNFDLIESETELQSARINLLATQADYALTVYNLKAMTGKLQMAYSR